MAVPDTWVPLVDLFDAAELEMPSLADIDNDDRHMGSLIDVVFRHEVLPREVLGRNVTYVRLVSRAVRSYERARGILEAAIGSRGQDIESELAGTWRATDEFETVFNSTHRALRILWTLKGMQASPIKNSLLPHQRVFKTVNVLRDSSEHIEDRLISQHKPHALIAYDKGFEYATVSVEYAELASWLEALSFLADVINPPLHDASGPIGP